MKYIIIGLGNYGTRLAEELSATGHEVIGVDESESRVDNIKERIATAFVMDATDPQSLSVLPLNVIDRVIVAIGEDLGASIRVVALLKQKQVKHIYARAIDRIHKAVLEAFNLDKILMPEEEAARNFVHLLDFGEGGEAFPVDDNYSIFKFKVPRKFVGYGVNNLHLETEFNLKLVAYKHAEYTHNAMGISMIERNVVNEIPENIKITTGDELICYGKYSDFQKLWKAI